jgi:dolichol-phosphate mannosyltransferase
MRESVVVDYPQLKLFLNRLSNQFIRILFGLAYNDMTNAFKMFRREVIAGVSPILSHHFNITVELPLKAIVRGFSYAIVPNNWYNRKDGVSKFRVKEMGSRYLFIVLYVLIEKYFSRGDYRAPEGSATR